MRTFPIGCLLTGILLAMTSTSTTLAQVEEPQPAAVSDTLLTGEQQDVLATEDAWVNAEINRDEATLRRVIDDRFVYNANNGKLWGKEDVIKTLLSWNLKGETVRDRTVLLDGDHAVVFGTEEQRFSTEGGEDRVSILRYTSIYVKRGEQWRAIALQMAKTQP